MFNAAIDPAEVRARLARDGRVQVADYLQPDAADTLRKCLAEDVPWTLALRDGDQPRTIDNRTYAAMAPEALAALLRGVADSARGGEYRFAYDSYMMVPAYKEGRDPGLLLHRVLEVFNSPEYIAFLHALTGDAAIRRVNAQATRYRRGHFLRYHTDIDSTEGRRFAYVLNLTREWRADWGGLLQFIDGDGRVVETYLPRYNSLSLFKVPAGHAVSLVAPWADQDRLAITGWALS
ncbi:2OG-Fe(II) oxygenase [Luteimonas vadosa]|uniref:2OG-Fe(II) oxygenase family protein n=1 Tax=Luteimonas vadosa TaxID=1165507 RepID=A0ABP9DV99_9GAMM